MSLVIVVGAGATGSAAARLLADGGHRVRLVTRSGSGPGHPGVERVAADAADADRLTEVADGAATLLNCAAPPYHTWAEAFPPLAAAQLTAAERTGADYVLLDNAYAYGQVDGPMTEDLPPAPNSVKGRVRAEVWRQTLAAHEAGRVRVATVRASDFIGVGALSVFTASVAPRVLTGRTALVPADLDAPHSWTATRDAARALVAVAGDGTARGGVWHAPTPPPESVRDLAARLARVAGARPPKLRTMPGWMLRAGGLFSPLVRELPEVQYQFRRPFVLDSSHTERTFDLSPTPLDDTLADMAAAA
ncbi:NAD-dependent epimerase/dehydratase family protein [Streptomyces sp. MAR4 CNX-425]|uniref:NAD-dependent epimerase/dehydratase family protein n=1 Tax=Streptomyces sp. MAR4 CNX-425 TaxID=3406343 RepID=UPI003B508933